MGAEQVVDGVKEAKKPNVSRLTVLNSGLLKVPVWEKREGAKNWAAIIGADPRHPGGLSRKFLDYARGDFFYMLGDLALFDAVEFAADRVAWAGRLVQERWFGVVVMKTDDFLELQECARGADAVILSKRLKQDAKAQGDALRRERDHYQKRASEVQKRLSELDA